MKRALTRITLSVLCLGLALSPVISAQAPDRLRALHLGVVWPGDAVPGRAPRPSVLVLSANEVLAEATDAAGDMQPPVAWMPFQRPGRDVTVGADSYQIDLPTFMLHSPQGAFSWSVDARALMDGTLHDSLDQPGTWQPAGTSTVSDPIDLGVTDYADLTQASVLTLDPQHLRFELQVRGNTAGAWNEEMYVFSLFPQSTQQWDTWLYLVPWADPPHSWASQMLFNPAVAPAPSLPYLDITASRITREAGEIVLQATVADSVPQDAGTATLRPIFAWWFNRAPEGGTSGGGVRWKMMLLYFSVGAITALAFDWGNPEWVRVAELQPEVVDNTVRVRVPEALLPLSSRLVWSVRSGYLLGDDPQAYYAEVDWTDDLQLEPLLQRIYLPVIRRNS